MNPIATQNMNIDPALCLRIDNAMWNTKNKPSENVIARDGVLRAELLTLLRSMSVEAAEHEKGAGLYRICTVIDFLQKEWGKRNNERGNANMHNARTQLKNWK